MSNDLSDFGWYPMNRIAALMLVGLLAAGVMPVAAAADETENLLPNGDFEQDIDDDGVPDGWVGGAHHFSGARDRSRGIRRAPGCLRQAHHRRPKGIGRRLTLFEVAEQAIDASAAGAAIVHWHARDPEDGRPTPDPDV